MLHDLIVANRQKIIDRTRRRTRERTAKQSLEATLEDRIALFLMQVVDALAQVTEITLFEPAPVSAASEQIGDGGALYGHDLQRGGFTIAQVVHCYGDVSQIVMELARETATLVNASDLQVLNRCQLAAIAAAVTEFGRQREHDIAVDGAERLGVFAHELRNLLSVAVLSFDVIKQGTVGVDGSTGAIHARSLTRLRALVERSLATVRREAETPRFQRVLLGDFIAELEGDAALEAERHGVHLTVEPLLGEVAFAADREILASAIANLLQNAFKFSRTGGGVSLSAHVTRERLIFSVADECGGLPPGKAEELFRPFAKMGDDHSGLGLGLSIARSAVRLHSGEIHVRDVPGTGCVFTVELPRLPPPTTKVLDMLPAGDCGSSAAGKAATC